MKVRTVAVALAVVVAAVVAVAATVDGTRRPPLDLPAASAFSAGPCRDVAEPVLSLGRFTYEHTGADSLPADAYPFLRQRAEELAAVRDRAAGTAPPADPTPSGATPSGATSGDATPGGAPSGGATSGDATPGGAMSSDATPSDTPPGDSTPPGGVTGGASTGGAPSPPNTVQQALSARIDAVLVAIGFLRLRPGKAYDPALLRDLEAARAVLQHACVSRRD